MPLELRVVPLEFVLQAKDAVHFPAGKATNIIRGALGYALRRTAGPDLYSHIFEGETGGARPSGYQEAPRPFVLRWNDWGDMTYQRGQQFAVRLHVFDSSTDVLAELIQAFAILGPEGLGQERARVELVRIRQPLGEAGRSIDLWRSGAADVDEPRCISVPLGSCDAPRRIKVTYDSPTEIKEGGRVLKQIPFAPLFLRAHERVLFFVRHYAMENPEQIEAAIREESDAIIDDARQIRTVHETLGRVELSRYSTNTGQTHPLSGFYGESEFEGDFTRLWNWLKAAEWTGVGRQTVWGKGAIRVSGGERVVSAKAGH